jgi:hypothetical protein
LNVPLKFLTGTAGIDAAAREASFSSGVKDEQMVSGLKFSPWEHDLITSQGMDITDITWYEANAILGDFLISLFYPVCFRRGWV